MFEEIFRVAFFLGAHIVQTVLQKVSMRYWLGFLLYLWIFLISANTGKSEKILLYMQLLTLRLHGTLWTCSVVRQ